MNPTPQTTTLNIQDVPQLFSKYWKSIILSTLVSTALCLTASNYVPRKYKAHFVLTIYSKYFQSPLVGDFVPGMSESSEMRSQRESLIRQILTPDYLDALGAKYGIYGDGKVKSALPWWQKLIKTIGEYLGFLEEPNKESILSGEREALRARIEIYSLNSTTFNVGFLYSDPEVTLNVTQDIYNRVIQSLLDVRSRLLDNLRDAIKNRLGSLSPALAKSETVSPPPTEESPIEDELTEVRSQLRTLTAQYTDEHPLVMQLRDRERILVNRLGNLGPGSSRRLIPHDSAASGAGTGEAGRNMYGDLTKKLNYLDIAIESDRQHQSDYFAVLETPLYPSAPLWPKRGLFAVWGMALGLFGSLFIAAIREYFERSQLHASGVAQHLGIPLLGELPPFPDKTHS